MFDLFKKKKQTYYFDDEFADEDEIRESVVAEERGKIAELEKECRRQENRAEGMKNQLQLLQNIEKENKSLRREMTELEEKMREEKQAAVVVETEPYEVEIKALKDEKDRVLKHVEQQDLHIDQLEEEIKALHEEASAAKNHVQTFSKAEAATKEHRVKVRQDLLRLVEEMNDKFDRLHFY